MEIQTYEVTEATTERKDQFEIDQESQDLIASLGLEGQQAFLVDDPDPEVSTKKIIPYEVMTLQEQKVYAELYPQHDPVAEYNAGPIPFRVLQVIAHAQIFWSPDCLEIWGPRVADPDPVLVAVVPEEERTWMKTYFLLARWGKSLEEFESLLERATSNVTERWTKKARSVSAACDSFIQAPDMMVEKFLAGDILYEPYTD